MPKSNVEFWKAKFERNVARDRKEHKALEDSGWRVVVIWECEINNICDTLPQIIRGENNGK